MTDSAPIVARPTQQETWKKLGYTAVGAFPLAVRSEF